MTQFLKSIGSSLPFFSSSPLATQTASFTPVPKSPLKDTLSSCDKDDSKESGRVVAATPSILRKPASAEAIAQHTLGEACFQKKDYAGACLKFEKAAEIGNAHAQYMLGQLHEKGLGVKEDYRAASVFYHMAAENGNADAQFRLGEWCKLGMGGMEEKNETARKWYAMAADQGHAEAATMLGWMFFLSNDSKDGEISKQLAYKWFKSASSNSEAQFGLGLMYQYGVVVGKNLEIAREWYAKVEAQVKAGRVLNWWIIGTFGYLAPDCELTKDLERLRNWYKMAAMQGDAEAQYFFRL